MSQGTDAAAPAADRESIGRPGDGSSFLIERITRMEERLAALKENVATRADLEGLKSWIVIRLYLGLAGSVALLATILRLWPDGQ